MIAVEAEHVQKSGDQKKNQIDKDAREGNQNHIPVPMPEIVRIDRHGSGPSDPKEEHTDHSDRI